MKSALRGYGLSESGEDARDNLRIRCSNFVDASTILSA